MVLRDIHHILESWTPSAIAWERDNVGLQIGSMDQIIRRILVTLDVTDEVLDEARRKRADLLMSHHPLLFHPLTSISADHRVGRLALKAIENNISLYAMHTNLDFAESGVSFALATALGLEEIQFLEHDQHRQKKIAVFVPSDHVEKVMTAMALAGAGRVGEYEACSFRMDGTGTFRPLERAAPLIGRAGELEKVSEVRLEMVAPEWRTDAVIRAMRSAHPYEEAAYDIYDLSNASTGIGVGAIGMLRTPLSLKKFLAHVQRSLRIPALRYAGDSALSVTRVAVCGGSGSKYVAAAIRRGADAFVTADVAYHSFQDTDGRIALIDAGHYETEQPVIRHVVDFLKSNATIRKRKVKVSSSTIKSNFIQYY
ncbi:MAG: Nif3-like dinuclear metal center hexameric protein [Ignavibacteriae bacterium]|nr:Nif3-like dinuclear metal center hexameric protein [Ignavibacteria bacterium]MBI3365639.1 Nif3-like dinuclear metal center hexameric protein [Ignavibacteriota bacterium]